MKTRWRSVTIVSIALCLPVVADAQPPVGALAVDEGQGEQYGWAVDYEGASAARAAALGECGLGGAGGAVLAVDHEQHEPGGVRGVPAAVPERGVQRTGGGAAGVAAVARGGSRRGVGFAYGRRPAARGRPPGAGVSATFGGPDAAGPAAGGDTAWTPGEVFRDCEDCPEMVVVPAGRFRMGCMSGQGCWNDELPVHEVQVGSFALSKYEVLFEDYDRFADATGRERPDDRGWGRGVRPVINVSWEDATAYAEWLSAQTGATYRLPSEAKWEYAARAGTTTAYSWGRTSGGTGPTVTAAAAGETGSRRHRRGRSPRTRGACTTCTGT